MSVCAWTLSDWALMAARGRPVTPWITEGLLWEIKRQMQCEPWMRSLNLCRERSVSKTKKRCLLLAGQEPVWTRQGRHTQIHMHAHTHTHLLYQISGEKTATQECLMLLSGDDPVQHTVTLFNQRLTGRKTQAQVYMNCPISSPGVPRHALQTYTSLGKEDINNWKDLKKKNSNLM